MDGQSKDKELIILGGDVENIIYYNEENGYTVFDMSVDEATGELPKDEIITGGAPEDIDRRADKGHRRVDFRQALRKTIPRRVH